MDMKDTDRQPTPTHSDGIDIIDEVRKDLQQRAKMGEKTYGTRLKPFNGRDALIDAYQEALDLAVYLKQKLVEEENHRQESYKPFKSRILVWEEKDDLFTDSKTPEETTQNKKFFGIQDWWENDNRRFGDYTLDDVYGKITQTPEEIARNQDEMEVKQWVDWCNKNKIRFKREEPDDFGFTNFDYSI